MLTPENVTQPLPEEKPIKYYYYHAWKDFHTTVVSEEPPESFLSNLLTGWTQVRRFDTRVEMEEFADTVGLGRSCE